MNKLETPELDAMLSERMKERRGSPELYPNEIAEISTAMSLKRIADVMTNSERAMRSPKVREALGMLMTGLKQAATQEG